MSAKVAAYIRQHHLALLCLFLILSGGTAYATHGDPNSISSEDIIDEEVQAADIDNSAVRTFEILNDTVHGVDITDSTIASADIQNGQVRSADVANESLNGTDVLNDSLTGADLLDGTIENVDVAFNTLLGDVIRDGTIAGADIADDNVTGADVDESSLGPVPQATTATTADNLERGNVYIKTNSVVVPGGSQDDSNGNGVSEAVSVQCNNTANTMDFDAKDIAVGGGAFWSGNANSNSSELENRIHSAAFITQSTGNSIPAVSGDLPAGYRVRGEVDKDGNDTLTVQVVCFPAL